MMICFQRALQKTGLDVGGPLRVSFVFELAARGKGVLETGFQFFSLKFRTPTTKKGERKSHAVREVGETGIRVAAVGCEYLGGESLRSQFGAGLKSSEKLNEPMERVGSSPAPFSSLQETPRIGNRFPKLSAKYLCLQQGVKILHTLKTSSEIARSCKRKGPFSECFAGGNA
jgi:hypothetical protein